MLFSLNFRAKLLYISYRTICDIDVVTVMVSKARFTIIECAARNCEKVVHITTTIT